MAAPAQAKMPDWRQFEGEIAGGEYPLERYLGGDEDGAVFLTRFAAQRGVIKLVPAGREQGAALAERWRRTATLRHPHLSVIFAAGTGELAGMPVAYLVTEYAEEVLGEVLRERPLTAEETRDMLLPVAEALAYLHRQGLVHGSLKPSNILAVQDTVKLSSDAVSAGDPSADILALGITLIQALTQKVPAMEEGGEVPNMDEIPLPFREIAQHCLRRDPRLRWSARAILDRLRTPEPPDAAPAKGKRRSRLYPAAAVAALGAAIGAGLVIRQAFVPAPSPARAGRPEAAAAAPEPPPPARGTAPRPSPLPSDGKPGPPAGRAAAGDEITRRVLPDIPARARNTIRGTALVVVRIAVDPAGKVSAATLERTVSPYFGRLALEAARQWRFAAVDGAGPRNWTLRFQIRRTGTTAVARRSGP